MLWQSRLKLLTDTGQRFGNQCWLQKKTSRLGLHDPRACLRDQTPPLRQQTNTQRPDQPDTMRPGACAARPVIENRRVGISQAMSDDLRFARAQSPGCNRGW